MTCSHLVVFLAASLPFFALAQEKGSDLALRQAAGALQAAVVEASEWSEPARQALAEELALAEERLPRVYPALRLWTGAGTADERVARAVVDAGLTEGALPEGPEPLVLPEGADLGAPAVGAFPLQGAPATLWATPLPWGEGLIAADWAGWEVEADRWMADGNRSTLVRKDARLRDAALSGEVRVDGGILYIVLRSDLIIKFHPSSDTRGKGAVGLKYGFNNLRLIDRRFEGAVFEPRDWVAFRAEVRGERLRLEVDGEEVFDEKIAPPRTMGQQMARLGYFGVGSFDGKGGFRKVTLEPLSGPDHYRTPRWNRSTEFLPVGDPVDLLADGTNGLLRLVHFTEEVYKPALHPVEDGMVTLQGSPGSHLSHVACSNIHYRVSGKLRLKEEGFVWLRVNQRLLFGVGDSRQDAPWRVKFNTGSYRVADVMKEGNGLKVNRWTPFDVEVRDTAARLLIDGEEVLRATTPAGSKEEAPLRNQFGMGVYLTRADVKEWQVQKEAPGMTPDAAAVARVKEWLRTGHAGYEAAAAQASEVVKATLLGERLPVVATSEDQLAAIDDLQGQGRWIEAFETLDQVRLLVGKEEKVTVDERYSDLQEAFDEAMDNVGENQWGPDRVFRTGRDAAELVTWRAGKAAPQLETLAWLPDSERMVRIDVAGQPEVVTPFAQANEPLREAAIAEAGMVWIDGKDVVFSRDGEVVRGAPEKGVVTGAIGHPRDPGRVLVAVDENSGDGARQFSECKVYAWDPAGGGAAWSDTGMIGQHLHADALGRYVYTRFAEPLDMANPPDTGFIPVQPAPVMEHLLQYRLVEGEWDIAGERSLAGMKVRNVVSGYDGRRLFIDAEKPFPSRQGPELPILDATQIGLEVGRIPVSGLVSAMVPVQGQDRVWIAQRKTVRLIGFPGGDVEASFDLPETAGADRVVGMARVGGHLAVVFDGDDPGIYFRPETVRTNDVGVVPYPYGLLGVMEGKVESKGRIAHEVRRDPPWEDVEPDKPLVDLAEVLPFATNKTDRLEESILSVGDWPRAFSLCQEDGFESVLVDAVARLKVEGAGYPLALSDMWKYIKDTENPRGTRKRMAAHVVDYSLGRHETIRRSYAYLMALVSENPADAGPHLMAARLCEALGTQPNRADWHRRHAAYFLPSSALRNDGAGAVSADRKTDEIFAEASPAVVVVRHSQGAGTGFLIGRNGLILTNHHVVDTTNRVDVVFLGADGERRREEVVILRADPLRDMALLQLLNPKDLPDPLLIERFRSVRTGESVVAIGNPGMGSETLDHTITEGLLSNARRRVGTQTFLQTSAAVNPGNSGGPLFDRKGRVIGMITLKAQLDNVGFAVPAPVLWEFVSQTLGE